MHPQMPKIGDVVAAKYRLERVAGEGGMGVVYAAEHLVLKQRVAVKVLHPDAASSEAVVERFAREARAAAKISSEHVARVLDAGSLDAGTPFLVMEFLEGSDLEELRALEAKLPVSEVVDYMIQALEGLAHAHAVNIVHRDLKPANLFLASRPDGSRIIKLLDFGISKATTAKPEDKRLTGQFVLGSPVYMSPEQLRNAPDIDGRADLWSVGVVAYELLAGDPPFDGEGVGEIFAAILEQAPVPLHERNPNVPEGLSDVISRCLRRDPNERWANAAELARALAPFGSPGQGALVERAEQVLARANHLRVASTPLETQLVVAAIEAAAHRARTSKAPPPLVPARPELPDDDLELPPFRRSRARAIVIGLGALALLTLSALGVARAMRSGADELASSSSLEAAEIPNEALAAPHSADAEPAEAASEAKAAPAPKAASKPRAPRARPAAPRGSVTRPDFLKTRE